MGEVVSCITQHEREGERERIWGDVPGRRETELLALSSAARFAALCE